MSNAFGRQVVLPLTNKSGGAIIAGDVVVIDTANNDAFTTTTSAATTKIVGIAQESIASNAVGRVLTEGYAALVNVNASVTRGNYGTTHTVAKQATDAGASRAAGTFCQFLTGGTTPDAVIFKPDLSTGAGGAVATDTIWAAAGDIVQGTGADTAAVLSLGSAAQGLVSTGSAVAWADILPWHVSIIPMIWTPDATTGTWDGASTTGFIDSGKAYPLYVPGSTANSGGGQRWANTSAAQNDAVAWDVILAKGTWDAHFWVRESTNTPIITLNQDGSSMGTVDTYAAAAAAAKVSITGWSVSTTGKKRMQILLATKNASSSGYALGLFAIEFRRTA